MREELVGCKNEGKKFVIPVISTLPFRFHEHRVIRRLAAYFCVQGEKFRRHGIWHLMALLEKEHNLRMESTDLFIGIAGNQGCDKSIDLTSQGTVAAIDNAARAFTELTDVDRVKHVGGVNQQEEDPVAGNRLLGRYLLVGLNLITPRIAHSA